MICKQAFYQEHYPAQYRRNYSLDAHGNVHHDGDVAFSDVLLHKALPARPLTGPILREWVRNIVLWGSGGRTRRMHLINACLPPQWVLKANALNAIPNLRNPNPNEQMIQVIQNGVIDAQLPAGSRVSFGSKLLMFLAPAIFPVLDKKVAQALHAGLPFQEALLAGIPPTVYALNNLTEAWQNQVDVVPDSMPWDNEYSNRFHEWRTFCHAAALHFSGHCNQHQGEEWVSSDVERLYFYCIQDLV